MRVVFDSNIFVSAFAIPNSQAVKAVYKVIGGHDSLIISKDIIDEVLTVLSSKFSRDREFLSRTALYLADISTIVKPARKIRALSDDADNRILECALAGRADCIVTGDKEMLALEAHDGIRIMRLRDYIEA